MPVRWTFPPAALASADGPTASTVVAAPGVDITPLPVVPIPPIWEVGMRIRIHAHGWVTTTSTTPTLGFEFRLAKPATALASGTTLFGATSLTAMVIATNAPWLIDYWGRVTAVSTPASATAGQIAGRGRYLPPNTLTAFAADQPIPITHAARLSAGFDTSFAQSLLLGAIISSATGTPNVVCEDLTVELIG
jgi:hypothetical protein